MARFGAKEYNLLSIMRTLSGLICINHEKLLDAQHNMMSSKVKKL